LTLIDETRKKYKWVFQLDWVFDFKSDKNSLRNKLMLDPKSELILNGFWMRPDYCQIIDWKKGQ
jgi:hypothetical protein